MTPVIQKTHLQMIRRGEGTLNNTTGAFHRFIVKKIEKHSEVSTSKSAVIGGCEVKPVLSSTIQRDDAKDMHVFKAQGVRSKKSGLQHTLEEEQSTAHTKSR